MEIVLGVSMDSAAVRMVLVEGEKADGVTVDHNTAQINPGAGTAASRAADQVVAAILGTRESAIEGGHRLVSTGVAWSDHCAAAYLRDALRAHGIEDVVLVSELHAASALAQAIGQAIGDDRIALVFLEGATATLAVVQTADGAVVKVHSRPADSAGAVAEMITGLETLDAPPQAVFVMGSGLGSADTEAVRAQLAGRTTLPVHAPQDADLALARGAALASADRPRYEAETVGLLPVGSDQTAAGPTLGYDGTDEPEPAESAGSSFLLAGSALSAIFVIGVAALVISLAVSIRPAADQRPDPGPTAGQTAVTQTGPASEAVANPVPAPQTIQAPIPVVQQAPRTVYVAPPPVAPVIEPVAPAPAVAPVDPAPVPQVVPEAPAAPVTVPAPVVAPIVPPWLRGPQLPSIFLPPITNVPPAQSFPSPSFPAQTYPSQSAPPQSSPSSPMPSQSAPAQAPAESASESVAPTREPQSRGDRRTPLWPTWPPFG